MLSDAIPLSQDKRILAFFLKFFWFFYLGILALVLPFAATLAGSLMFGWLFILAGIAQSITLF
jgi:uncharacterized membrane protein HdeD (DUF308 family)